jgi:hypothetical protein
VLRIFLFVFSILFRPVIHFREAQDIHTQNREAWKNQMAEDMRMS